MTDTLAGFGIICLSIAVVLVNYRVNKIEKALKFSGWLKNE